MEPRVTTKLLMLSLLLLLAAFPPGLDTHPGKGNDNDHLGDLIPIPDHYYDDNLVGDDLEGDDDGDDDEDYGDYLDGDYDGHLDDHGKGRKELMMFQAVLGHSSRCFRA